jgi:hypothetical protein
LSLAAALRKLTGDKIAGVTSEVWHALKSDKCGVGGKALCLKGRFLWNARHCKRLHRRGGHRTQVLSNTAAASVMQSRGELNMV